MHPFNLLCLWRHFILAYTEIYKLFCTKSTLFFFPSQKSICSSSQQHWMQGTQCSLKIKITHKQSGYVTAGMHKHEKKSYGAPNTTLQLTVWGHCFIHCKDELYHFALHATTHIRKATHSNKLAYSPCAC